MTRKHFHALSWFQFPEEKMMKIYWRPMADHGFPERRCLSVGFPHRPLFLLTLAFLLLTSLTLGQSTDATLSGSVEDAQGAVIPGVKVTIINPSTGFERTVQTDGSGLFAIPLLQPGTYTVLFERDGFTRVQVPRVTLNVNDRKALQIQLKVGSLQAAIEVRGDSDLIEETPAVATVVDRQFASNLPLNGRSLQSLISLTPGVVAAASVNQGGQFSVNGQRTNANYFTVDGVSANAGIDPRVANSFREGESQYFAGTVPGLTAFGGTNNLVSVDALEEFKIQTSTYAAEFGRQPGGQVQLSTRSGKNNFHGTAYDYVRNEKFDANNWFTNSKALTAAQVAQGITKAPRVPLRQNQFGGTVSGPIITPGFGEGGRRYRSGRNRSFFFFSYEGLRLLLPQSGSYFVPSLRLRQIAAPGLKPILNGFALPTGPEVLSNTGVPTGVSPITYGYSNPSNMDVWSLRVDHNITHNVSVFARYNDAASSSGSRASNQLNFLTTTHTKDRTLTVGTTWVLNPQLTNELKVNYIQSHGIFENTLDGFGGATPFDPSLLIDAYTSQGGLVSGSVSLSLGGATPRVGTGPQADSFQRQLNIVDNITHPIGAHVFKFGIDYRRLAPIYGPSEYARNIIFSSESNIVNGIANSVNISSFKGSRPLFRNFSAYAQDTWKLSRRLTLDLGVRWELNPPPTELTGIQPVVVIGIENMASAHLAPAGTPFYQTPWKAFAPRLGFSYLLSQRSGRETVVRGGFGVYYDLGNGPAGAAYLSYPFGVGVSRTNVPFPLTPANAAPAPFPTVAFPIASDLSAVNPDLKLPYTLQWSLSVQRSLGSKQALTVSYVGNAGRRLLTSETVNQPQNGASGGPRPNPNFSTILYTTNGPTSDYNALQAQFQRRLSRGVQALVSYTWAHSIDEVTLEASDYSLLRGNSDFDVRHNLSGAVTYDLPTLGRGTFVSKIFGGWETDLVVHAQQGYPVDVFAGFTTRPDGSQLRVRPDYITGQPFYINDPLVAGGRRFNSAAFLAPPNRPGTTVAARPGSFGRNILRGLPIYQTDVSLHRRFSVGEKFKTELKLDAFNVFNHPMFSLYGAVFTSPSAFGVPLRTLNQNLGSLNALYQLGGPRSIQLSLRVGF